MPRDVLRRTLTRVDDVGDTDGLPVSLLDATRDAGGLWWASDAYTSADEIVAKAREVGAVALRLDVRDLSLLESLPAIRYLHVRSDGRPVLDPIASLNGLQALILETGALRGSLDPLAFPDLRWLRLGLGGKGGAAMLPSMATGHPGLEWLAVSEVKSTTLAEIASGFPELRYLEVSFADHLRGLGQIRDSSPRLRAISMNLTQIRSLDGIADLGGLDSLGLMGGRVSDLGPLRGVSGLRYARLLLPDARTIEPLRGHPSLRLLELSIGGEPDGAVLESIPGLMAVGRGRRFEQPVRWPDLFALERDDPLRTEWSRAMRG